METPRHTFDLRSGPQVTSHYGFVNPYGIRSRASWSSTGAGSTSCLGLPAGASGGVIFVSTSVLEIVRYETCMRSEIETTDRKAYPASEAPMMA
jgi:hypothetical protein